MRPFLRVLAACSVSALSAPLAAQERTLVFTHFLPGTGLDEVFVRPWADELTERSNGQLKVDIQGGDDWLGNVALQYDQVESGLADIAFGVTSLPRGRFICSQILEQPFIVDSRVQGNELLLHLFPEYLGAEYSNVKVLMLSAAEPGVLFTKGVQVRDPSDIDGLRIRTTSPAMGALIQELGGVPSTGAPELLYDDLAEGRLDGFFLEWWSFTQLNLADVVDYGIQLNATSTMNFVVMNQDIYDDLPADQQQSVDDMSLETFYARTNETWSTFWEPGQLEGLYSSMRDTFENEGGVLIRAEDAPRDAWIEAASPTIARLEQDLAEHCGQGIIDAAHAFLDR